MADNILEIQRVYDIPPDIRKQYDKSELTDHFKKLTKPNKENQDLINQQSTSIIKYAKIIACQVLNHVAHFDQIHKLYLCYLMKSLSGPSPEERRMNEIEKYLNDIKKDLKDIKGIIFSLEENMKDIKMGSYIHDYNVFINYLEIEQHFNKDRYTTHASNLGALLDQKPTTREQMQIYLSTIPLYVSLFLSINPEGTKAICDRLDRICATLKNCVNYKCDYNIPGEYIFPQWESKSFNTRQPDVIECFSLLANRLKSSIVQKFEFEPDDTLGYINNENTSDPEIFSYVCNKLGLLKPGIYELNELNDPKTVNSENVVRAKIEYREDIDYADLIVEQDWIKTANLKNEKHRMGLITRMKAMANSFSKKRFTHQSKDGKVVFYINDGEYEIIPVKHTNSFSPFVDQTVKILFQHYKSFLSKETNMIPNSNSKRKLIILKKTVTLQDKFDSFKKCTSNTEFENIEVEE
ncbi:hypothetical protein C2G38_2096946 [Gigaspora rosea]|uniref:Uncharacterized protein n=1 Tax=Gigaspora rosea TaxID=44941 RepID=A0A397V288_9GLOM|nr:hypothetical protein C2G38_2096946 [Gigaspora rosea]CAG8445566.1 17601_t:CDS:1 [Gigaspora rosea]